MWPRRRDRELEKELRFHIENQVEENLRAGMTPAEARRQAILAFGSPAAIREECREVRTFHWLGTVAADLRYALRGFRASPLFTLAAVVSIALGIGANAAIFTLLHAAMWKPLPVARPAELFHAVRTDGVWPNISILGRSSKNYAMLWRRMASCSRADRPDGANSASVARTRSM